MKELMISAITIWTVTGTGVIIYHVIDGTWDIWTTGQRIYVCILSGPLVWVGTLVFLLFLLIIKPIVWLHSRVWEWLGIE